MVTSNGCVYKTRGQGSRSLGRCVGYGVWSLDPPISSILPHSLGGEGRGGGWLVSYKATYVRTQCVLSVARVKNHQKNVPLMDWFWLHLVSYILYDIAIFSRMQLITTINNTNIMKIITILCLLHIIIVTWYMYRTEKRLDCIFSRSRERWTS